MERRKFTREFKLEAARLIKERGVSYAQASQNLGVHTSQLRVWVKKFADDPEHVFPGHGQMKPEQLEIARLKREVTKLKAERDILTVERRPNRFGPPVTRPDSPMHPLSMPVERSTRCSASTSRRFMGLDRIWR
jgi:transposase